MAEFKRAPLEFVTYFNNYACNYAMVQNNSMKSAEMYIVSWNAELQVSLLTSHPQQASLEKRLHRKTTII